MTKKNIIWNNVRQFMGGPWNPSTTYNNRKKQDDNNSSFNPPGYTVIYPMGFPLMISLPCQQLFSTAQPPFPVTTDPPAN